jgi:hypothetical protein
MTAQECVAFFYGGVLFPVGVGLWKVDNVELVCSNVLCYHVHVFLTMSDIESVWVLKE